MFNLQRFGDNYATCMISNLPIRNDQSAYGIILTNNSDKVINDSFFETNELYYPVYIPVLGIMNDYGEFESIEWNEQEQKCFSDKFDQQATVENFNQLLAQTEFCCSYIHADLFHRLVQCIGNRVPIGETQTFKQILTERKDVFKRYMNFCKLYKYVDLVPESLINLICINRVLMYTRRFWNPSLAKSQYTEGELTDIIVTFIKDNIDIEQKSYILV